jgi:hypothetical protein
LDAEVGPEVHETSLQQLFEVSVAELHPVEVVQVEAPFH